MARWHRAPGVKVTVTDTLLRAVIGVLPIFKVKLCLFRKRTRSMVERGNGYPERAFFSFILFPISDQIHESLAYM